MNRGIARRPLFENEADTRFFLSRLARSVRRGLIRVHAYCVMTTHFHLLVESPKGKLSAAMKTIQNEYSRWFNRSRRRDGTLFRGRFTSRPVTTLAYRRILVRYIDANSVGAGIAAAPALHPHGSARWYARERGPIWLAREWVEECVRTSVGCARYRPQDYARAFGGDLGPPLQRLVERRLAQPPCADDPLDDLLSAASADVLAWMKRKARLADGIAVGLPVCDEQQAREVIDRHREVNGAWEARIPNNKSVDAWPQIHVALMRDLCGSTFTEISMRIGLSINRAWRLYQQHQACMEIDEVYAQRSATITRRLLRRVHAEKPPTSTEHARRFHRRSNEP